MMESQEMYIIYFHFDQADIDVNGVDFVKIQSPIVIIPSSISVVQQDDEYLLFVSSFFKDQQLLRLKANFEVQEEPEVEKRQRLGSDASKDTEQVATKKKRSMVPELYNLTVLDSLTTISPVTCI